MAKKIYDDAKDKNVACILLYANESKALFYDAEFTKAFVPAADGVDMFVHGVVALFDGAYYKPTSVDVETGVITFPFPTE